jgi:hypothetical protein
MVPTLRLVESRFSLFSLLQRVSASLLFFLLLTIFSAGAFALPVVPGTIFYVTEFGSGAKSGYSWEDASPYLQAMIDGSTSGDEIWVAGGSYPVSPFTDGYEMKEGVKIYGGFAGTEETLADRDLTIVENRSTLQAGGTRRYAVDNSSNSLTNAALLDGFTLSGGTFGGITNNGSSPTLVNLVITGNAGGFAVIISGSSPILINCAIVKNTVVIAGIINFQSSPVLINCTIARSGSESDGVGILNDGNSALKVRNSIISGRSGGIRNQSGTTDILHSMLFSENPYDSHGFLIPNNVDPRFVDPAGGDFTLQRCSRAVNGGSNTYYAIGQVPDVSATTIDLAGYPRFYSLGVVDMGAYEYQGDRLAAVPGVWFVKEGGTGSGLNWECAMSDLQLAINSAAAGEQVWVAGGTYLPVSGVFSMKEGVKIYGGFAGTEASLANRDFSVTANKSTLRRTNEMVILNNNNMLTYAAVLDGFTITGAAVGIVNYKVSPMLVNLVITGNRGGGVANANSSPAIINCAIIGNAGTGYMLAVDNVESYPVIINCTIANNTTTGSASVGVYNHTSSSSKIRNSIIYGNQKWCNYGV